MKNLNHNLQSLCRLIATYSRGRKYDDITITEREAKLVLRLLIDIVFETLTQPGGKIALEEFGILQVCQRAVGGVLKRGDNIAQAAQHFTYTIRFRPSQILKDRLKHNSLKR